MLCYFHQSLSEPLQDENKNKDGKNDSDDDSSDDNDKKKDNRNDSSSSSDGKGKRNNSSSSSSKDKKKNSRSHDCPNYGSLDEEICDVIDCDDLHDDCCDDKDDHKDVSKYLSAVLLALLEDSLYLFLHVTLLHFYHRIRTYAIGSTRKATAAARTVTSKLTLARTSAAERESPFKICPRGCHT